MSFKYMSLMLAAAAAHPSITIKENGKPKTLYAVGPDWYSPKGGDRMEIPHGGRSYLATSNALGPDNFYGVNLLGGSISYDVDLSQSGCSCNAALYLISMPGKDWNGNPSGGEGGDYYCDANMVNGQWCPEFDIMEANTYAWHSTPHKCDSPNDKGHYSNCDRGGNCFQVAHQKLNGIYGPGNQYPINTQKEFHVKFSVDTDGNFKVEFTQNGQTHSMASDGSCFGYLGMIKNDLANNMALAISNWGTDWGTMSWLDQDTGCQGECNNNPTLVIKNIEYTSGSGPSPGPGPKPGPTDFDFGSECQTKSDDDCSLVNCKDHMCKWSWPRNDPAKWSSKDAKCRCQAHWMEQEDSILY